MITIDDYNYVANKCFILTITILNCKNNCIEFYCNFCSSIRPKKDKLGGKTKTALKLLIQRMIYDIFDSMT